MERKYGEEYQCAGCGEMLTDETGLFDVEGDGAAYCAECYYEYPYGAFFGEYDNDYRPNHPTEKQGFCIDCQECCGGCWYLRPAEGCSIYPYRPRYCRGYECDKIKAAFNG